VLGLSSTFLAIFKHSLSFFVLQIVVDKGKSTQKQNAQHTTNDPKVEFSISNHFIYLFFFFIITQGIDFVNPF
jgi:hypothetical protein